jgi:hypothetical protein
MPVRPPLPLGFHDAPTQPTGAPAGPVDEAPKGEETAPCEACPKDLGRVADLFKNVGEQSFRAHHEQEADLRAEAKGLLELVRELDTIVNAAYYLDRTPSFAGEPDATREAWFNRVKAARKRAAEVLKGTA